MRDPRGPRPAGFRRMGTAARTTETAQSCRMMFWGFGRFLRLLKLTVSAGKGTFGRLTPRRLALMVVFLPGLFFGQLVHWIGFFLDDVFFRRYRTTEVRDPVFIIGIPRSGTTLLHRVMAQDTDNFTSMRLWEMILAPSITERKFWMTLGRLDRLFGGYGRRLLVAADSRFFRCLRDVHKVSLLDYDEDDLTLVPIFSSMYLFFPFPFREELWKLVRFDESVSAEDQDRIMGFYRGCIQRHLYVHGPGKRFLSKNPAFSPKIEALRTHFPGARIVCNMRNPYNTVPSLMSALRIVWDACGNAPQGESFRDGVLELAEHWYRHPIERSRKWPESHFAFVTYGALMQDLYATVEGLYGRFGFGIEPGFSEKLSAEHERARAYKSKHRYCLEQYGLTHAQIRDQFGDVFDRFGFDTAFSPAAEVQEGSVQGFKGRFEAFGS